MADFSASQARFQMIGTRAAMRGGPIAEAIDQQIHAIENALESVPDFAFDLSKTLVESVCKTVLADIGPLAEPNWDALMQTPGARIYYEDHADFNEAFDNDNETIRVSDLGLRPSEVLFKGDPGAYKAALNDHIAEQNGFDDRDDPIAPGDDGLEAG